MAAAARPRIASRCARRWAAGLLCASLMCAAPATGAATQIITHSRIKATALDADFVRAVFTMRLREWPDGSPIHVFVLPDRDPGHLQFCLEQLGTYPYVLRAVWTRLVFTGTGFEPVVVRSEDEMREKVRSTPGAIGYLPRSGAGKAKVRVVPVRSERSDG